MPSSLSDFGFRFRVNSERAVQFRQWATGFIRNFAIRGYVLDKERLKNGAFLNEEYFDHLLEEILEIRASERRFYQKITDSYATAMDYSKDAETTQTCFPMVQNIKCRRSKKTMNDAKPMNSILGSSGL